MLRIDAQGKRRSRAESAQVRQALAQGQAVLFANRHQRYHYQRRPVPSR